MDKKSLKDMLKIIQTLRETKGKEMETLEMIEDAKSQALELKDYEMLVTLCFETALVSQHTAMNEFAKEKSLQDISTIDKSIADMEKNAHEALEIVVKNKLNSRYPQVYRYLGRVNDYKKDFSKAIEFYQKAKNAIKTSSYLVLELNAFIAYSTLMSGYFEEGERLSKEAYYSLINSPLGRKLKDENYVDWAIWLSGIPTRYIFGINELNVKLSSEDKNELVRWLNDTKDELENPTGKVTWGDNKFQFRLDEINKALDIIK